MAIHKIFNDPVYGFIRIPTGIILEIIEHPYFQRLQRIRQLGLTHFVYPGAVHTRFHHALGAFHLMTTALNVLREKGVDITPEEYEASQLAILLHDIGHGPFSHVLEHTLVPIHHEAITLMIMEQLNLEFEGQLTLAITIFKGQYHKQFLHQLISSQLDVDRLDYLTRDSFYTGVAEGVIGYDRLLLMIDVVDQQLVIEEKAIYSIEKFLTSRKIMYWQVYMHKTCIAAEFMLQQFLTLMDKDNHYDGLSSGLKYFLSSNKHNQILDHRELLLQHFNQIDDIDIWFFLKKQATLNLGLISELAYGLIFRKLYKIQLQNEIFETPSHPESYEKFDSEINVNRDSGTIRFIAYNKEEGEIMIKTKSGNVKKLSEVYDVSHLSKWSKKYYKILPYKIHF
ncbi:MAG: HD domain-containing protein [Saprospiraceae bacterium]|nr:HD domain-containing protein [Saprospiraceae bacterium]